MMDELISRQAAIDALDKRFDNVPKEQTTEILLLRKDLRELPSASLNCSEFPNNSDTISRQAAIDVCDNVIDLFRGQFGAGVVVAIKESIEELPSAQPATDTNVGTKLVIDPHKIERAIRGLTEWQKHVQTESDIDRDISVAVEALKAQLGTNLAEVGTDLISRKQAIDEANAWLLDCLKVNKQDRSCGLIRRLEDLPPAQPEIVRCKDCKHAEYIDDVQTLWCTECGQGRTVAPHDFCSYAERRTGWMTN